MRNDLKVDVISQYEEFLKINESWNVLLKSSLHPFVFLTHEWIDAWWKAFGEGKELFILLVYDKEDLIAIAPFMYNHGPHILDGRTNTTINARKIEFIANVHSNRADMILAQKPEEACDAIISFLLDDQKNNWDLVSLEYYCRDSPTLRYLENSLCKNAVRYKRIPQMASPYVSIDCRWNDYFGNLKPRFKKNLTYSLRRLGSSGNVKLITYQNGEKLADILEKMFNVASKSWKAKAGTALSSTPQLKGFYADLACTAAKKGWLELFMLYLEDIPLAFQYCLRFENRLFLLKTEFDEDYRTFGVGNTIQWKVLESVFESGLAEFDLLGSSEPWKKFWSDGHEREHIVLYAFNKNGKGRFLNFVHGIKDIVRKTLAERDIGVPHERSEMR